MFIEVHVLQSFAPSNLNRDDTGNPKDTEFGGVRRARISSQCIKRSIRLHPVFSETTQADIGMRTRWITRLLTEPLITAGRPAEQAQQVAEAFAVQYSKMDQGHTSVLLYLSKSEIEAAVNKLSENWDEIIGDLKDGKSSLIEAWAKEMFKGLRGRTSAPDIAMFGRMLAEHPELNIDAACQVAHAISTHRVSMEMDFYTAVDDLLQEEETGAGMMGVIPFNSACFYRYACINWEQLLNNLGGDAALARKTVAGFLRAAALAVPTGKQTSFAAQNPPDFLLGVCRADGQAWSLANAFEKPVRPDREGGLISPSIAALDTYWGQLMKAYGDDRLKSAALILAEGQPVANIEANVVENLDRWVDELVANLPME